MAPLSHITQHFNLTLALSCLLFAVSQFNYGFDNQAFATTQAMNAFDKQFGEYNAKTHKWAIPSYFLSLLNSLNYIGFAVGLVVGSIISSRYGRKICVFSMSCWALITATIAVTSQTKEQILLARILNYVYVGMELSVVPIYQSEVVPTQVRGFMVGTYQLSIAIGGLVINSICKRTSTIESNAAWRIPYGLFFVIPTIVLSLVFFVPESPRWLISRDRMEDARASLRRLRQGVRTDDEIELELHEQAVALAQTPEQGRFVELFQGTTLKRTLIVICINFFQQATGQAFASQYGAVFVKSLGTINPFSVTLWNSGISICVIIGCLLMVDKVGRRPLLIIGSVVQIAALFTMAGLGVQLPVSVERKSGIVAMISVFATGFGIGWAALTYVITTEIIPLRLRDHGQRIASLVNILTNFLVSFTLPYLLNAPYADLQSKVGFIFGSFAVLSLSFAFFCVPDCHGKSLEEIDRLFHQGVAVRDFKRAKVSVLEEDSKEDELVVMEGKRDLE